MEVRDDELAALKLFEGNLNGLGQTERIETHGTKVANHRAQLLDRTLQLGLDPPLAVSFRDMKAAHALECSDQRLKYRIVHIQSDSLALSLLRLDVLGQHPL